MLLFVIATLLAGLIAVWFSPGMLKPAPEVLTTPTRAFKTFLDYRFSDGLSQPSEDGRALLDVLILFTSLFVVAGATIESFADKMAWEDQAKQYARMQTLYTRAEMEFGMKPTGQDRQDLLREMGREALAENADWVILRRSRVTTLRLAAKCGIHPVPPATSSGIGWPAPHNVRAFGAPSAYPAESTSCTFYSTRFKG